MPSKLRILFLSNRGLLPIRDDHTRRSYHILKGLAKRHSVYFLSLYESESELSAEYVNPVKEICQKVEFFPAPKKNASMEMALRLLCSLFSLEPYTIWRHYSKEYARRVEELATTGGFDLVHCDILPLWYAVKHLKRIRLTLTDHDVSYLKAYRIARISRNILLKIFLMIESLKLYWLEKHIFERMDLGVLVSESDKEHLQKICPHGKFLVVENGVDTNYFRPARDEVENNTLIWVGGFQDYSNEHAMYSFLTDVYPLIKETHPAVRLQVIGGKVTPRLLQITTGDPSVRFEGYVEDPLPYMQRAAIFVNPLQSGGGTKLKILEAMAVGLGIVTTPMGCEGLAVINGVHCLVSQMGSEFAQCIARLLDDQDLLSRIGEAARRLAVDRYDWRTISERLNDHYLKSFSSSGTLSRSDYQPK